jgi:hypothetical protein
MSTFSKGDTFLFPLNCPNTIDHLWAIISDPDANGSFAAANLTDFENNAGDTNCIIEVGEHPYVTKRSVIKYGDARLFTEVKLQQAEAGRLLVKRQPLSGVLLAKIQNGALTSDDTPPQVSETVRTHG